ncbi:MAG: hypothetical protein IPO83_00040 [Chitinophagaceae bacterium]|nr:hypothetical protein [Chitinophagaceae bacterium]
MNQLQIAERSKVLSALTNEALAELGTRKVEKNHNVEKYLLGVLERVYVFTSDISTILNHQPERLTLSAFVISRVILDDFLHVCYLFSKGFAEDVIDKFDVEPLKYFFAMGKENLDYNIKYFEGKHESFINEEIFIDYSYNFLKNQDNLKYISHVDLNGDIPIIKFQLGISTAAIYKDISSSQHGSENCYAYNIWRRYSAYVHHSTQTFFSERNSSIRTADVEGIRLVLFYACKTLVLSRGYFIPDHPETDPIFMKAAQLTKELGSK